MKRLNAFFLTAMLFLFLSGLQAQTGLIELSNPSFEYQSATGVVRGDFPEGYTDCGFKNSGAKVKASVLHFSTLQSPSHGETYISLTVNDNQTGEEPG